MENLAVFEMMHDNKEFTSDVRYFGKIITIHTTIRNGGRLYVLLQDEKFDGYDDEIPICQMERLPTGELTYRKYALTVTLDELNNMWTQSFTKTRIALTIIHVIIACSLYGAIALSLPMIVSVNNVEILRLIAFFLIFGWQSLTIAKTWT